MVENKNMEKRSTFVTLLEAKQVRYILCTVFADERVVCEAEANRRHICDVAFLGLSLKFSTNHWLSTPTCCLIFAYQCRT